MEMMVPVRVVNEDSGVLEEIERSLSKVKMNLIDSSAVEIGNHLGEGNFGIVYKGMWNATPVVTIHCVYKNSMISTGTQETERFHSNERIRS
jgi:hypothetical protein